MKSELSLIGRAEFPEFSGLRIMMMPVRLEDELPPMCVQYQALVDLSLVHARTQSGVAYLTVDEAFVRAGEYHRRPGLHTDGSALGGWGGPKPWASSAGGMYCAASHYGCMAWAGTIDDAEPGADGDCDHLRQRLRGLIEVPMEAGKVFHLGSTCIHEARPATVDQRRQFFRLSMPSDGEWYEGYTPSPVGVMPTGAIRTARAAQMSYRT